jgi:hypothetical protein
MVSAGESAGARADGLTTAAARYRQRADNAEKAAEQWQKGKAGEILVAELLDKLSPDGFFHLDDRRLPDSDANIDHVVVGPSGAFIIDTKNWSGSLTTDDVTLRQNGRRRDSAVESLRTQAIGVSTVLESATPHFRVPVWPVLCFVGSATIGERVTLDRVHLVDGEGLAAFIKSGSSTLTPAQVEVALAGLRSGLPERTAPYPVSTVPVEAPSELVVFLDTWRKSGRHRLYVKGVEGQEIGYLDLLSGAVHAGSPEGEPLLGRLLPHFVKGDTPGIAASAMTGDARGVLRRFLDSMLGRPATQSNRQPILAAYRWRGHGKNRLYLHRIDGTGTKTELGWVDVEHGHFSNDRPDAQPLLAYCGQQYRSFSGTRKHG